MRRIQLVLAVLAIVVTALAAFPGPVMAQVYNYDDNYYNQDFAVNGYWYNPYYGYYPYYYDDGYYRVGPDAYYPYGPNGPWSFYYTGDDDISFEW